MWTDNGCRGTFVVDGAKVVCDVYGEGRHYCGPVTCTPWISDLQREILFNTEIIEINQQVTPQGRPITEGDLTVWSRALYNENDDSKEIAVALYNEEDESKEIGFDVAAVGYTPSKKRKCLRLHFVLPCIGARINVILSSKPTRCSMYQRPLGAPRRIFGVVGGWQVIWTSARQTP